MKNSQKVVGARQCEKALAKGALSCVVVAPDAAEKIRDRLIELCKRHKTQWILGPSLNELGSICGIEVGASAAGILKPSE